MKKAYICLMVMCAAFFCGYNVETGNGCTHQHNSECGYESNDCIHTSHMDYKIEPYVDRGGDA